MQTKTKNLSLTTREFLRPKLMQYPKVHRFSISLQNIYCFLTGFMHVLPDFYIIGAAKSGTSSLYEYLIQHPAIYSAVSKEPRFFDKYYDRGINYYRVGFPFKFQKFSAKRSGKDFVTGEATVRYLDHPFVPKRIKELTPNAKFLVLLRNPIERAFSHYTMMASKRKEELTFEEAINQEQTRTKKEFEKMEQNQHYYSSEFYHHAYLDRGIYVKKLQLWMNVFPKNQFLIIQSENFFKNPSLTYKSILKFLNLSNWELNEYKTIGPGKYKKSQMNPNTRKKLIEYFKPYNEQLFEFLGERFDWNE